MVTKSRIWEGERWFSIGYEYDFFEMVIISNYADGNDKFHAGIGKPWNIQ